MGGGRVEHTGDGTLVTETSRDDVELVEMLKRLGFRWSRRLEAWYLPRSWREETRLQRVQQLQQARPSLEVDLSGVGVRQTVQERETQTRLRASDRAERMEARAARAEEDGQAAQEAFRRVADGIPLGQPVLVGHHSQRRHERDLERMGRQLDKAGEAASRAEAAHAAAGRARSRARGEISTVTLGRRIERTEAELRRLMRRLEGSGKAIHGEDAPATGAYRERLEREQCRLLEQLDYDRGLMASRQAYGRDSVDVGDLVRVGGLWLPVRRVNQKSVTVPSPMVVRRNQTAPWHTVTGHVRREEATVEQVLDLAAGTSAAFPELRRLLEELAGDLPRRG